MLTCIHPPEDEEEEILHDEEGESQHHPLQGLPIASKLRDFKEKSGVRKSGAE